MNRSALLPAAALLLVAGSAFVVASPASAETSDATNVELTLTTGTVTDVDQDGTTNPGDTVGLAVSVKNIGGLDIKVNEVDSDVLGAAEITVTCPTDWIKPGASVDCTVSAPYTITEADQEAGQVEIAATVHAGIDDDDTDYTSSASVTVQVEPVELAEPPTATPTSTPALPNTGA